MVDQFYTRPDIADRLAGEVLARWPDPGVLFVEPSAGSGAFLRPLERAGRKVRAMDIDPRARGVRRGDFLECDVPGGDGLFAGSHSAIVVLGNPPFGRNASTAVRFFNHAAARADEVAFIVPRTFRKASLQNRLHRRFHLVGDVDVAAHAFIRDGHPHDVPCAWQIWARRTEARPVPVVPNIDHLVRFTEPARADFAMRRVGYYAGRVVTDGLPSLSATTHYFLREMRGGVIDALRRIDWLDVAAQTAGVRSLSKAEIARKLHEACRV